MKNYSFNNLLTEYVKLLIVEKFRWKICEWDEDIYNNNEYNWYRLFGPTNKWLNPIKKTLNQLTTYSVA
jgi:hypothetical protein